MRSRTSRRSWWGRTPPSPPSPPGPATCAVSWSVPFATQRHWCLVTEWESVGAYRRALGGFDVKITAVPRCSPRVRRRTVRVRGSGRGRPGEPGPSGSDVRRDGGHRMIRPALSPAPGRPRVGRPEAAPHRGSRPFRRRPARRRAAVRRAPNRGPQHPPLAGSRLARRARPGALLRRGRGGRGRSRRHRRADAVEEQRVAAPELLRRVQAKRSTAPRTTSSAIGAAAEVSQARLRAPGDADEPQVTDFRVGDVDTTTLRPWAGPRRVGGGDRGQRVPLLIEQNRRRAAWRSAGSAIAPILLGPGLLVRTVCPTTVRAILTVPQPADSQPA